MLTSHHAAHAAEPASPLATRLAATFAPAHHTESSPTRRLYSDDLLAGNCEVLIEHGAATYRLRLTALGKLILTK